MKKIVQIIALPLLVLSLFSSKIYSQCTTGCDVIINKKINVAGPLVPFDPLNQNDCNPLNIPAGKIYCVVAGGSIVNSANIHINGTLRICGGSINNVSSGNIIFPPGNAPLHTKGLIQIYSGAGAVIGGRISNFDVTKITVPRCPLPTGITFTAINTANGQTITCNGMALPIELLNFNGHVTPHNTSMLTWGTASEKNNDYFSIEYADDGLQFSEIAQVKGQGDSKTEVKYQYEDTYFRSGKGYYRLRQTDFDGSFSYSPVIMLTRSNGSNGLAIYPNPVEDKLHIRTGYDIDNSSITLMDSSGRKVNTLATIDQGLSTLSTVELSPGIYYLKVVNANEVKQFKIVKQ